MADPKRLYEVINPSDAITFRATVVEAMVIAERLATSLMFVKDIETGEVPGASATVDLQAEYDAIWRSTDLKTSYATAWRSFLVGRPGDRQMFEAAVATMTPAQEADYRRAWHDQKRTSMNDLCSLAWNIADKIDAYAIEEPPHG